MKDEKEDAVLEKEHEGAEDVRVRELLAKAQAGDADAEAELFRIYSRLVKTVAFPFSLTSDFLDSEDIVSAGMIGLLKAVRTFDFNGGAKFETYASHCIKNAIIDEIRRFPASALPISEEVQAPSETQFKEILDAILSVLSPMERHVILLRLNSMSYAEIAAELGIQKKKVDNLISSAKRKIKERKKKDLLDS